MLPSGRWRPKPAGGGRPGGQASAPLQQGGGGGGGGAAARKPVQSRRMGIVWHREGGQHAAHREAGRGGAAGLGLGPARRQPHPSPAWWGVRPSPPARRRAPLRAGVGWGGDGGGGGGGGGGVTGAELAPVQVLARATGLAAPGAPGQSQGRCGRAAPASSHQSAPCHCSSARRLCSGASTALPTHVHRHLRTPHHNPTPRTPTPHLQRHMPRGGHPPCSARRCWAPAASRPSRPPRRRAWRGLWRGGGQVGGRGYHSAARHPGALEITPKGRLAGCAQGWSEQHAKRQASSTWGPRAEPGPLWQSSPCQQSPERSMPLQQRSAALLRSQHCAAHPCPPPSGAAWRRCPRPAPWRPRARCASW